MATFMRATRHLGRKSVEDRRPLECGELGAAAACDRHGYGNISAAAVLKAMSYQEAIMVRAYWFRAKRYGWGWGLPLTWQGWAVFIAFICLVVAGAWLFPPHRATMAFVAYMVALSIILVTVCWMTGEPPRWRWGDEDTASRPTSSRPSRD